MLLTLDESGEMLAVPVRVGQAVDTVAQAGRPKTITGGWAGATRGSGVVAGMSPPPHQLPSQPPTSPSPLPHTHHTHTHAQTKTHVRHLLLYERRFPDAHDPGAAGRGRARGAGHREVRHPVGWEIGGQRYQLGLNPRACTAMPPPVLPHKIQTGTCRSAGCWREWSSCGPTRIMWRGTSEGQR